MKVLKGILMATVCAVVLTGCGYNNSQAKEKLQPVMDKYAKIAASKDDGLDDVTREKLRAEIIDTVKEDCIPIIDYSENKDGEVCIEAYISKLRFPNSLNIEIFGFADKKDATKK